MLYTGIEKVLVQGIGFAQGVVLARLLKPEDFGLAAMLGIFLGVGTALAESGLGMAYVVYGRNSRRVFWWNVGIGAAIYAVLAALAPFIAAFYGEPVLKPLLWVMGLGMVLNAASVLGSARLQRERRFGALSSVNVVTTLAAFLAAVALALCGWGVWAIAWVGVVAATIRLAFLAAAKTLDFSSDDGGDFGKMLGYGLKLTLSGLIHTAYVNSYNLVVGKMFSPATVGLFSRGQRWSALPMEVVNESIGRIALPDIVQYRISARRCILLNALILWPMLVVLWLFADVIVGFVLGAAWMECVPYLRILLVGVFFTPVSNISLQYIRARGRSDLVLLTDAIKKPIQFAALVVAVWMVSSGSCAMGVLALCWAKVAGDVAEASSDFFVAWRLRRRTERMWSRLVRLADLPIGTELRRMHERRALDRIFEGRNVAVVGNGPSETGKGLGAEVDGHDIVVRINNYRTEGYEADYGSKVDVWMKGGAADISHGLRGPGIKAVLYGDDIVEYGMLEQFSNFPGDELKKGLTVDYVDSAETSALAEAMGAVPSSGAKLIERLRRVRGAIVDVYGFAFLEPDASDNNDGFVHYANDVTPEEARYQMASGRHDVNKETEYLRKLFNGRRLKCC